MPEKFLIEIRNKARKKILFLPHAISQMNQPDRMISPLEIREVIFKGEIVEDYPEDARGYSCLLGGRTSNKRYVHAVCAPKDEYVAVITAYVPTHEKWENGYKKRRR